MKVSKEVFEKSAALIKRNARPLEAARWSYLFEGGSPKSVIDKLSAFQNPDGGFGHGLEADNWLPSSSAIASWTAGQILMETDADPNEEIVRSLISYLIKSYNHHTGMWKTVQPENNDYPHAPWWGWKEDAQDFWMFNPAVELAAMLIHWSPKDSEAFEIGWASIEKAVLRLMNAKEMDHHEINNFQKMVEIVKPYENTFALRVNFSLKEVADKVYMLAEESMEKDISFWNKGYRALPLDLIESPEHPLYKKYESLIEKNLHYYLAELNEKGYWDISWEWADYPEEFAVAKRYLQGILLVGRYKLLNSFGLVD